MTSQRRRRIVIAGTLGFGVAAGGLITLATGAPQVGLHGGFWIMLPFALWLESRLQD